MGPWYTASHAHPVVIIVFTLTRWKTPLNGRQPVSKTGVM